METIYEDNLYFIGMTFKSSMTQSKTNSINPFDPYFDQFKGIYLKICRTVVGKRFSRKDHLQPLAFAFIDDEGTRNHVLISYPFQNLHIHAVMLLPRWTNDQRQTFEAIIDDEYLPSIWNPNIDSFHVEAYDPAKQTVTGMISYAAKGYLQSQHLERQFGSMWQRYPEAKSPKLKRRPEILRADDLARSGILGIRYEEKGTMITPRLGNGFERGRYQSNKKRQDGAKGR